MLHIVSEPIPSSNVGPEQCYAISTMDWPDKDIKNLKEGGDCDTSYLKDKGRWCVSDVGAYQ